MSDVTQILSAIEAGDSGAAEKLLPMVYAELRRLAATKMAQESPDHTLQATALVHEAYLRLTASPKASPGRQSGEAPPSEQQHWDGPGHFFAAAAEAMRRILIENARRKRRQKSTDNRKWVDLETFDPADEDNSESLLVLDDALSKLGEAHAESAEVVKLRYFAGLTIEQTAKTLGISVRTTNRHWAFARAYLYQQIYGDSTGYH
ncbi:MAG: sigma-70 family RNA polymerase sigma factor [Planctomycetaceae bacterium]